MKKVLVVLVHGIFGWGSSEREQKDPWKDYFHCIEPFLEEKYASQISDVLVPTLPPSESIEVRGACLQQALEKHLRGFPTDTELHIIGHSMGGLDARWVIAEGEMVGKIKSLTTIGTPHQGTSIANLAYSLSDQIWTAGKGLNTLANLADEIHSLLSNIGLNVPNVLGFFHHFLSNLIENSSKDELAKGLRSLTLEECQQFNVRLAQKEREARERHGLRYFAYGGVPRNRPFPIRVLRNALTVTGISKRDPTDPIELLNLSRKILTHYHKAAPEERAYGNDGAVSIWSSRYPWDSGHGHTQTDHYMGTVPFDHFRQVNWRIPDLRKTKQEIIEDIPPFYFELLERILHLK